METDGLDLQPSTDSEVTGDWENSYKPLPTLFLCLFGSWGIIVLLWTWNTWSKRHWQSSNLQWALTSVPVLKTTVLGLSFVFWYSCVQLSTCSFWVAFGVFVSRIFFETACFVSFLLIAHGFCIMHEQLSILERRSIAGLASLLYLTLTGYKAAVPHFSVLVGLVYALLLYVILSHTARNVGRLQEQLHAIETDGAQVMRHAVCTKLCMFRQFQAAMIAIVLVEIGMHTQTEGVTSEYWLRLLLREFAETAVFCYMGWAFRSRHSSPYFSVIPTTGVQQKLPPIHRVEMTAKEFDNMDFQEWNIGVPTSPSLPGGQRPVLVIVQNPGRHTTIASEAESVQANRVSVPIGSNPSNLPITNCLSSEGKPQQVLNCSRGCHQAVEREAMAKVDELVNVRNLRMNVGCRRVGSEWPLLAPARDEDMVLQVCEAGTESVRRRDEWLCRPVAGTH